MMTIGNDVQVQQFSTLKSVQVCTALHQVKSKSKLIFSQSAFSIKIGLKSKSSPSLDLDLHIIDYWNHLAALLNK